MTSNVASDGDSPEQLTLLRDTVRKSRTKEPAEITTSLPVARIAVDVSLPHLDRPFDYLVPDDMAEAAQPGARVKVRFAGKDLDGFVLERLDESDHDGKLVRLRKVVSAERVLTPEIADLCRAVADRYAGVLADVTRLAVPPRHAKVEGEPLRCDQPARPPVSTARSEWSPYPPGFLDAIERSESPRAVWTAVPGADWAL
ncbi:MAG TPA: primosome assembly protein PriA, partial [Kribbella sp.]